MKKCYANIRCRIRLRKLRSGYGAIVVATAFALIPILFVCAFLMDGSRTMLAKSNIESTEALTIQSVLSHTDPILQNLYGLYGLQQDMQATALIDTKQYGEEISGSKEVMDRYIDEFRANVTGGNVSGSDFMRIKPGDADEFKLRGVENASLQNSAILETQINDFAKYRSVVQFIQDLMDKKKDAKDDLDDAELVQKASADYAEYFAYVSDLNAKLAVIASLGNQIKEIYNQGVGDQKVDKMLMENYGQNTLYSQLKKLSEIKYEDVNSDTPANIDDCDKYPPSTPAHILCEEINSHLPGHNSDVSQDPKYVFYAIVNSLPSRLKQITNLLGQLITKLDDAKKQATKVKNKAIELKTTFTETYKAEQSCTKGAGDAPDPRVLDAQKTDAKKAVYTMCWNIFHTDNQIKGNDAPLNKINRFDVQLAANALNSIANTAKKYADALTSNHTGKIDSQDYLQWFNSICANGGELTMDFINIIASASGNSVNIPSTNDIGNIIDDWVADKAGKIGGMNFKEIINQFTSAVDNIKMMTKMGNDSGYYINAHKDDGTVLPSKLWCSVNSNRDRMCQDSNGVGDLFKDVGIGILNSAKGMLSLVKDFVNGDFSAAASSLVTSGYLYYMFDDMSSSAPAGSAAYGKTLRNNERVINGEKSDLQEFTAFEAIGRNLKYRNYSDLEYIIDGHSGQYTAITSYVDIFLLRMLLDFMSTFSNKEITSVLNGINAIPIVGPVISILVRVAIAFIEAGNDMVHLTINGDKVPFYKGANNSSWYMLGQFDAKKASFGLKYRDYLAISLITKIPNDNYREPMLMRTADVLQSKMYYAYKESGNYNTPEALYYAQNWRMKYAITNVQLRGNFKSSPFFMDVIPSDYFRGLKNSSGWGFYNFSVNSVGGY